jgi:predicted nucleotidyltransferase component of viral defense system
MRYQGYRDQVHLLLYILPEVAKEHCFALHGGTAINLFIRDMPRLSVDIDLTYLPIEERATSLVHIDQALTRIKARIEAKLPDSQILHKSDHGKLHVRSGGTEIKLEVNLINRGTIQTPKRMLLCDKAQETYDLAAVMPVVPFGQLYGGKICAALDRQHPRDLFDIKLLLINEGVTDEVKQGFLLCLLSSDRPIHEIVLPHLLDQRLAMENQFSGMSQIPFSYADFEQTRAALLSLIAHQLTEADKAFLLSIKSCQPNWDIYDFARFPAVQWKLHNLEKLKTTNPDKHAEQYKALSKKLTG